MDSINNDQHEKVWDILQEEIVGNSRNMMKDVLSHGIVYNS